MLNKKLLMLFSGAVLTLTTAGVAAWECGDSVCITDANGRTECLALNDQGLIEVCTPEEPCVIRCS